ncbi:hypothetical protein A3E49_03750 [Candidatus Saccharibacteria bacterium RIFCSPHIGHO2_12_FULL_49_19]|nr:MAG: hypothetical protein A3E49_03750 [Candidatus Saccharibacteria bacterium RIFCSPHIGHO2_12_FULL_49_19]
MTGLLIAFTVFSSLAGSGSEIIFIVITPLILVAIFIVIIIKFAVLSRRLITNTSRLDTATPSAKRKVIAGWIVLGIGAFIGLLFIGGYIIASRSRTPHVSAEKAISYINECKVREIDKGGLGTGKEITINLKPELPEATDAYGGINYFTTDPKNWDSLVAAADAAEPACGPITQELYYGNPPRSWITLDEAEKLLDICFIREAKHVLTPDEFYKHKPDELPSDIKGDRTDIVLISRGFDKELQVYGDSWNILEQYVKDNEKKLRLSCPNEKFGSFNPFKEPAEQ